MASAKINAAIREILDECYESSAPITVLGKHVEQLYASPTWSPNDVLAVQVGVLKILLMLEQVHRRQAPELTLYTGPVQD
jgi:hypothetical protein